MVFNRKRDMVKTIDIINNYTGSPDSKEWLYYVDNFLFDYEEYMRLKSYKGKMTYKDVKWMYDLYDTTYGRKTYGCSTCSGTVRLRLNQLVKSFEQHEIESYQESNIFNERIIPLLKNFKSNYEKR